jgi:hypothetical protein
MQATDRRLHRQEKPMQQCQQRRRRRLFQQTDPLYHPCNRWSEAGLCVKPPAGLSQAGQQICSTRTKKRGFGPALKSVEAIRKAVRRCYREG